MPPAHRIDIPARGDSRWTLVRCEARSYLRKQGIVGVITDRLRLWRDCRRSHHHHTPLRICRAPRGRLRRIGREAGEGWPLCLLGEILWASPIPSHRFVGCLEQGEALLPCLFGLEQVGLSTRASSTTATQRTSLPCMHARPDPPRTRPRPGTRPAAPRHPGRPRHRHRTTCVRYSSPCRPARSIPSDRRR